MPPSEPKTKLGLPDLDHSKAAVLESLRSLESKRGYCHAIDEFIQWYCSEPRLSFNKVVVTRFRIALENRGLAAGTINGRLAAVRRLRHTVGAMLALTFGTDTERERTIAAIRAIHRRVNGTLGAAVGPFPVGTRYSAEDPALVLWVHLTLLESIVMTYELLVHPLTEPERDAYCETSVWVATALGAVDADVPRTWKAVRALKPRRTRSWMIMRALSTAQR